MAMSFKQPYLPSDEVLKKYADVLVNFALGGGKGIKKGEVVRVSASESAKPLYMAVCNAVVDAGGHVLAHYGPDDEHGDKRRNISVSRYFYEHATDEQIKFFSRKYLKGVDGKRIMMRGQALKPFMDWRHQKEWAGKFTWTIALYGTPAMAKEAGLSEKEYWQQIIKACFLDEKNPIAKWKAVYRDIEKYRTRLNKLSPS